MATKKTIPFIERISNPKYRFRSHVEHSDHYVYLKDNAIDESTGRPITKLKKQLLSKDRLKHLQIDDFCVENLQISGAIDKLNNVSLDRDAFSTLNHLEQSAVNIVNNNSKTE